MRCFVLTLHMRTLCYSQRELARGVNQRDYNRWSHGFNMFCLSEQNEDIMEWSGGAAALNKGWYGSVLGVGKTVYASRVCRGGFVCVSSPPTTSAGLMAALYINQRRAHIRVPGGICANPIANYERELNSIYMCLPFSLPLCCTASCFDVNTVRSNNVSCVERPCWRLLLLIH